MKKKWIVISLLLLLITGLLEWQLLISVRQFNAENDLARMQTAPDMKQKLAQDKSLPPLAPPKNYLPAEFAAISGRNIFAESRTKEEKTDAAGSQDAPPLTQKPILVGVTIIENERKASIIDPAGSPQDRNRRAQIKRIGDVYQGYTITSINPDQIVLENGARKEIIPLHEGSKRGAPGKTAIQPTRVVPIGGSGVSGSMAVSVAGGSAARTPALPAGSAAIPAGVAAALPGAQTPGGPVRQPAPQASQPAVQPTAAQPQAQPTIIQPGQQAPGSRVIRTPFGDVIRPNAN